MTATPDQLKARWETPDGKQKLKAVVGAANRRDEWSVVLKGFPFVDEVKNGRDLRGADLCGASLHGADLHKADLRNAILVNADLVDTDLRESNLSGSNLSKADLSKADLSQSNLSHSTLGAACLYRTNLNGSDLTDACLMGSLLVDCDLQSADLSGASVFGTAVWRVPLKDARQKDLVITDGDEPTITVDDIRVAQFIHLLLHNKSIRDVIDTITSKVVLILGRFTPKRKAVLDAIRQALRDRGYCPVLFDFTKPKSQDFMETVSTLAHMARFVVADFTAAKIVLEEVPHIVRNLAVPVQPLMKGKGREPVTLCNLRRNHRSLLATHRYRDEADLIGSLDDKVISPAEAKVMELRPPAR